MLLRNCRARMRAVALTAGFLASTGCMAETGTSDELATAEEQATPEQVGSQQQALDTATAIDYTYQYAFGRHASPSEVQYWLPRFTTSQQVIDWHKNYLQTNQPERRATIARAYHKVYNRQPSTNEVNSWDSYIIGRDYVFITLCGKHEEYARNIGFASTGSYTTMNWGNVVGFTTYHGLTYDVPPG